MTKPTNQQRLYEYLDRIRGTADEPFDGAQDVLNFDDLNANAWQMFERSGSEITETVCRWAIERGVKLVRTVKTIKVEYVEFDPSTVLRMHPRAELAERGYVDRAEALEARGEGC